MFPDKSKSGRYVPTEMEIRAACDQIQLSWSERECESRWVGDSERWKLIRPVRPRGPRRAKAPLRAGAVRGMRPSRSVT
jgi:hypothetical protein